MTESPPTYLGYNVPVLQSGRTSFPKYVIRFQYYDNVLLSSGSYSCGKGNLLVHRPMGSTWVELD